MMAATRRRGIASVTVMGQAPHYLQRTTNPAMRQALLTVVARLLDLELDVSPGLPLPSPLDARRASVSRERMVQREHGTRP
jgi:hypothetical protein